MTNELSFMQLLFQKNRKSFSSFPDKKLAEDFADGLFHLLFASYEGKYHSAAYLLKQYQYLKDNFSALIFELLKNEKLVNQHAEEFFASIPRIYEELLLDAEAILHFDPAAQSIEEVLVAYPGFYATAIHRIAHQLHIQGLTILPRLLSEYAHSKTGIDIHPGAQIGKSFFIDHGTGIVIGETTVIGDNIKIYQGVTLGALNVSKENAITKRHPTIEDNVVIY